MKIKFFKLESCSGDYIFILCNKDFKSNAPALAERMCRYHSDVGAEGLVLVCPCDDADAEIFAFGANGAPLALFDAHAIGAAELLFLQKKVSGKCAFIRLGDEIKPITRIKKGVLAISVGTPEFAPEKIPVKFYNRPLINTLIEVGGGAVNVTVLKLCAATHCAVFKNDLAFLDMPFSAPAFEHCSIFQGVVNTEFIQIVDRTHLRMRAWEYGQGESFTSAASAGAALAAAVVNKYCEKDKRVEIFLKNGSVKLIWQGDEIFMTGTAKEIFAGTYTL